MFRALATTPCSEVKVCILGQDPYHTPDKANGLAFGYHDDYEGPVDSSLANIVAELRECYSKWESDNFFDFSLEQWAEQGVLLINTRLSVEQGKPMSHAGKYGWEHGISDILKFLAHSTDTIFMLWGREARDVFDKAVQLDSYEKWKHRIVTTSHPCKFSHKSGKNPFSGSRCFVQVNEFLTKQGKEIIQWT